MWFILISIVLCLTCGIKSDIDVSDKTFVELFHAGTDAYLEERWQDCIDYLDTSMKNYNEYKKSVIQCRSSCRADAEESRPIVAQQDIEDLQFYERAIKNTLCLIKCKKKKKLIDTLTYKDMTIFEQLKPYDYLQLCHFQKNMLPQAANAAFTFLVANPGHASMLANLKFYSQLPEVDSNEIKNLEAPNFVSLYVHGSDAYSREDYEMVIQYFEESLVEYLRAEEDCRAYCEAPFDQGWFPDFVPAIANHFTFVLRCKRKCVTRLSDLNGETHDDILPSHYHYLQFAYFKVGKLKRACQAAMSYMLFYPVDETMLENIDYYKTLPKAKEEFFKAREEAVLYVQRQHYETKLMDFISAEFTSQDDDEQELDTPEEDNKTYTNNSSLESTNKLLPSTRSPRGQSVRLDTLVRSNHQVPPLEIVLREQELNGTSRFLAERVINLEECNLLLDLARFAAIPGDGYKGQISPHTQFEKFEGVTIGRAALLVYFGLLEPQILGLLLNVSDKGKNLIIKYFQLKELYLSFAHLVCRTAITEVLDRSDLSHSVHADNCNIKKDGTCAREAPAYTWRDYSAIIYLNQDFEGGEFIFADDIMATNIQSEVEPRCGRLVGFSAGAENLHGVKAVRRGSRCALALWFTQDPAHQHLDTRVARAVLSHVRDKGTVNDQLMRDLETLLPQ